MSQEQSPTVAGLKVRHFDTDVVYQMLNDDFRQRVVFSLANSGMKTARDLTAASGMKRHTSLKHLTVLCESGIVLQQENNRDRRQPFYTLSPKVAVCKTNDALTVNFGRGTVRFVFAEMK